MNEVYFATGNENKYREAKDILNDYSITLRHFPFKHREIRSDSLEEIAIEAVLSAYSQLKKPVVVEDSGLFIPSLNNFPGTYTAWVHSKIGLEGLLKLLEDKRDRTAFYIAAVAFTDGRIVITFTGELRGRISKSIRGSLGFGHDPIFIPEGSSKTFGEDISKKKEISHRARAFRSFADWFSNKYKRIKNK